MRKCDGERPFFFRGEKERETTTDQGADYYPRSGWTARPAWRRGPALAGHRSPPAAAIGTRTEQYPRSKS